MNAETITKQINNDVIATEQLIDDELGKYAQSSGVKCSRCGEYILWYMATKTFGHKCRVKKYEKMRKA
jgi:hypothetical protein